MRCLQVLVIILFFRFPATGIVEAHAFLDHASPAVGSKVKHQPREIRIWFTEPIVATASSIKVYDAMGKQVDNKDRQSDAGNKPVLRVSLPLLAPGVYKVVWNVMSVDNHHTSGDFTFRVVP